MILIVHSTLAILLPGVLSRPNAGTFKHLSRSPRRWRSLPLPRRRPDPSRRPRANGHQESADNAVYEQQHGCPFGTVSAGCALLSVHNAPALPPGEANTEILIGRSVTVGTIFSGFVRRDERQPFWRSFGCAYPPFATRLLVVLTALERRCRRMAASAAVCEPHAWLTARG